MEDGGSVRHSKKVRRSNIGTTSLLPDTITCIQILVVHVLINSPQKNNRNSKRFINILFMLELCSTDVTNPLNNTCASWWLDAHVCH